MFLKTVVFALLIIGIFAEEFKFTEENKEKAKELLRTHCKKNNAEDKAESAINATTTFVNCLTSLINIEQLKKEIEDAKPNGALDEVFKKYCAKSAQLKTCIGTLSDALQPCLDEKARAFQTTVKNATDQLIDFVCYKDGDRIALFISEKGPECFQDKVNTIRECASSKLHYDPAAASLSEAERCSKYDEFSGCVVSAVEQCETPTPANMAESLFKFVRKSLQCEPKN